MQWVNQSLFSASGKEDLTNKELVLNGTKNSKRSYSRMLKCHRCSVTCAGVPEIQRDMLCDVCVIDTQR